MKDFKKFYMLRIMNMIYQAKEELTKEEFEEFLDDIEIKIDVMK